MKFNKLIAFAMIAGLGTLSFANAFSDLTNEHWAYEHVQKMTEKGVISGYSDGTFKPEKEITREEFATILTKSLELPQKEVLIKFKDIESDRWSKKYIDATSEYLTGYVENGEYYFRPLAPAVREDMAVAIVKAKGLDNETPDYTVLNKFSDEDSISENLRKYVAIAVQNKIMNGNTDGTFNPLGNLTRAELTALINNVYEVGDKVVVDDEIIGSEKEKYSVKVVADRKKAEVIGEGEYVSGEYVEITIIPKTGYRFLRIQSVSNIGVDRIKIVNDGNKTILKFSMIGNDGEIEVLFASDECSDIYYDEHVEGSRYVEFDSGHKIEKYCKQCKEVLEVGNLVNHNFINGKCECGYEVKEEIMYGELNGDGKIDLIDVGAIEMLIGQTATENSRYDVNLDKKITKMDCILVIGKIQGNIELPHNCTEYIEEYQEKDDERHIVNYTCECGKKIGSEEFNHNFINGKCECGYEVKEEIMYGDVNEDNVVNNKDVTRLQQYVSGKNVTINKENADVFVDGNIDVMDIAVLMKKLSDWDIEFPHRCGKYRVGLVKKDNINHRVRYQCSCPITYDELEEHNLINDKCECGYVKEYNADYLEEAIDDVVDLGIMDLDKYDNEELDESVTKEEMALYVGKLIGMLTNDIDEIYEALERKEIIPIDLDVDSYNENEKVTQAEAVTMIVRALGWGVVVEQIGEWPSNYINKAAELRLFKEMVDTGSEYQTKGQIATLIHNALDAKRWEVTESSDGKLTSSKNPATLREMYFFK